MEQWQIVLMGMDVPMLLWLSRLGIEYRVMCKGWWAIALYSCVMLAGVGYFIWFLSQWCGCVCP